MSEILNETLKDVRKSMNDAIATTTEKGQNNVLRKIKDWYTKKTKLIKIGILGIIGVEVIILIPTIIYFRTFTSNYISDKEWVGFLGSYIGSVIGGIITLLVLYINIRQTREIQNENKLRQDNFEKREKMKDAISIMPMLDIVWGAEFANHFLERYSEEYIEGELKEDIYIMQFFPKIKNIGKSPIKIIEYKLKWSYLVNQEQFYRVDNCADSYTILEGKDELFYNSFREIIITKEDKVRISYCNFIFKYKDMFDNTYNQEIALSFHFDQSINRIELGLPEIIINE